MNVDRVVALLEHHNKIQVSALLNLKELCEENIEMACTLFGISECDAQLIISADSSQLQSLAATNSIFNCESTPRGGFQALLAASKTNSLASLTSIMKVD